MEYSTLVTSKTRCSDCQNYYPHNELIAFQDPYDTEKAGPIENILSRKQAEIMICEHCYNIRMYDCYPE